MKNGLLVIKKYIVKLMNIVEMDCIYRYEYYLLWVVVIVYM